jgi:hypothetical protein
MTLTLAPAAHQAVALEHAFSHVAQLLCHDLLRLI